MIVWGNQDKKNGHTPESMSRIRSIVPQIFNGLAQIRDALSFFASI